MVAWRSLLIRMIRALLLSTVVCALGCNPGQELLSKAEKQRAAGGVTGALDLLGQVDAKAPASKEAARAHELGARWALEAADHAETQDAARELLGRALVFDPKCGAAAARLCAATPAEDESGLRACVARLAEASAVPEDIAAPLRERVARGERARMLESAALEDWKALVAKYPASEEARAAALKIHAASSICARLDGTFGLEQPLAELERTAAQARDVVRETDRVEAWVPELHLLVKPVSLYREKLGRARAAVRAAPILPGEEGVRDGLAADFDALIAIAATWEDALQKPDVKVGDQGIELTVPQKEVTALFKRAADATVAGRRDLVKHDATRRAQCAAGTAKP
jgi:hypothetical protein